VATLSSIFLKSSMEIIQIVRAYRSLTKKIAELKHQKKAVSDLTGREATILIVIIIIKAEEFTS